MESRRGSPVDVHVALLGAPRLVVDGVEAPGLGEKSFLLIAFLLLETPDGVADRGRLASMLWGDRDPEAARNNLRQLLSRIRAHQARLDIELVRATTSHVRLLTEAAVFDVDEVRLAAREPLSRLGTLHAGELVASADAAAIADGVWLHAQRAALRTLIIDAAIAALEAAQDGEREAAYAGARRLLDDNPCCERLYRALMLATAARGDIATVKRLYHRCRWQLRAQLQAEPEPETAALFRRLTTAARPPQPSASLLPPAQQQERRLAPPRLSILPPLHAAGPGPKVPGLADMVLEDVTIGLARLGSVAVVAAHTSWQIGTDVDDLAVERFDLDYVLKSTLSTIGPSDVLSVWLLDAQTRTIVWAERYGFGPSDAALRYREIADGIAGSIAEAMERESLRRALERHDPAAYHLYLTGQRGLRHLDLPSIRKARVAFKAAAAQLPNYAAALSGMARALQREWLLTARQDTELLQEAMGFATRAVEADPQDARGYRELGVVSLFARRFDESLEALATAERLSPHHADLLVDAADTLGHSGSPELGLGKLDKAIELNPLPPDLYWWTAAGMHYQRGRYREAIETASRMKDDMPAQRLLAAAWALLGQRAEARRCARRVLETYPDFRIKQWLSLVPNRNAVDTAHYEEGLRAAGLT